MKMQLPFIIIALAVMALIWGCEEAFAGFNLWQDIETQTQWTLGSSVEAGTAVAMRSDRSLNLKAGQFTGSALASVSNYRMLNLAAGGTFIPQNNGSSLKATETVKLGLNLAYMFKGFTNQPPALIKSLVIGPSFSMPIWTTPHVVIPWFDVNYTFGGVPN